MMMRCKTKIILFILFSSVGYFFANAQSAAPPAKTEFTKKKSKEEKEFEKEKKAAVKRFWSMQTKEAQKQVKATNKRQEKMAKQRDKKSWDAF